MTIFKATYTITMLGEFASQREAEQALSTVALSTLGYEMDEGEWVGQTSCTSIEPVLPAQVTQELLAIGNDGTFFEEI